MNTASAERLGWSVALGPDRTVWVGVRSGAGIRTVVFEPTRQRLLRQIERIETLASSR